MNLSTELTDDVIIMRPFRMADSKRLYGAVYESLAEKIGAHYEGILLNRMVVGKAIYDAHMYSLLPSDFGLVAQL